MANLFFLQSSSDNPWFNLGLEEYFFKSAPAGAIVFYLWQNRNTVVIGRTQNAWKECRVSALEADGGRLARRSSGGGAVYHDMGNLCYTFICTGGLYDQEKQLKTILDGVKSLGIDASFTGRNDITADGRKFSGNAFKFDHDRGLMHGTLMVDTDSTKLSEYLSVSKAKLSSKGISSVRSRVVNLVELRPDITVGMMKQALSESFRANYGDFTDLGTYGFSEEQHAVDISGVKSAALDLGFCDFSAISDAYSKYSSWDFRLGENPMFDVNMEKHFTWGCVELNLSSAKGLITSAKVYTDAMDPSFAELLEAALLSVPFDQGKICDTVSSCCPPQIATDICSLVRESL